MSGEDTFWRWFIKNEQELFEFDSFDISRRNMVFNRLAAELRKVHPELVFEFGPTHSKREFVISAGGIKSAFPSVIGLVKAAPALTRWQFTAFRQRRSPISPVEIDGRSVDPADVQFSVVEGGRLIGIHLFIPDFREGDTVLKQIGYLLLDDALGEYDVETQVGLIEILSPDTQTEEERFPLRDLPAMFDRLLSKYLLSKSGGRLGMPS